MKTIGWVLLALGLVVVLAVGAVGLGLVVNRSVSLAQGLWDRSGQESGGYGYGMMGTAWQDGPEAGTWRGPGMMGYDWNNDPDTGTRYGPGMMGYGWGNDPETGTGYGPGMMGYGWEDMPFDEDMPCAGEYVIPGDGPVSSLEDVEAAVHAYAEGLGYSGLEVSEVMEFEHNYYAILAEGDTGTGAMEVLVDKESGAIGPEPGPNMMWNAEYGMHGRAASGWGGMMGPGWGGMMGPGWGGAAASGEMSVTPEEAEGLAQDWLDANLPGRTAGEPDPFYGYYTLHFLEEGQIEGMLSVHGSTGDVWYHSWHGAFVQMIEGHD
jgi:hypothetical protein